MLWWEHCRTRINRQKNFSSAWIKGTSNQRTSSVVGQAVSSITQTATSTRLRWRISRRTWLRLTTNRSLLFRLSVILWWTWLLLQFGYSYYSLGHGCEHGVDFYHNQVDILASGRFFGPSRFCRQLTWTWHKIESIVITIEPILSSHFFNRVNFAECRVERGGWVEKA